LNFIIQSDILSTSGGALYDVPVTNWWGECGLEVKPSLTTPAAIVNPSSFHPKTDDIGFKLHVFNSILVA
jgi:hypothetical protein